MYQVTKKQIRPTNTVDFFNATLHINADYLLYFTENYINTGKFILSDNARGDSDLELVSTILWSSKEAWEEFQADTRAQTEFRAVREAYFQENGITETKESATEI